MSESRIAGISIFITLALVPIGFAIFGSRFTRVAPLVVILGITVFSLVSQRKRKRKKQDLLKMRDELLQAKWEKEHGED